MWRYEVRSDFFKIEERLVDMIFSLKHQPGRLDVSLGAVWLVSLMYSRLIRHVPLIKSLLPCLRRDGATEYTQSMQCPYTVPLLAGGSAGGSAAFQLPSDVLADTGTPLLQSQRCCHDH